ncbi:MAG: anthranilate phosphoribosyltransferase [Rhizomicrobium sp.]
MLLLIDNYDSFTYNLFHYLGQLGADVVVRRNDELSADEALAMRPEAVVLSPGPCTPNEAGICLSLIEKANGRVPILGVCLGHQAIGQIYGGEIVRAPEPMHGKVSRIHHTGKSVFRGLNNDFLATRYHSLTIAPESMPASLEVTATSGDGVIQGVMHKTHPVHGVQFHPESIASENGHALLQNFLTIAKEFSPRAGMTSVATFAALAKVSGGAALSERESMDAFDTIFAGHVGEEELAEFLLAIAKRGPTVTEITGAAKSMRANMRSIEAPPGAIDLCGTGGDGHNTLNISTAVSFVVAGAGVPVAKHGNRSATSRAGAADVLEALGVKIELSPERAQRCLEDAGSCFLFARIYHPAMRHVAAVRSKLGVRTIFNLLGPLSNPAGVKRQLLGVYAREWLEPMAEVLAALGSESAWVVHGSDGLDEMTTAGETHIAALDKGNVQLLDFNAVPRKATLADLKGGDAQHNAAAIKNLLDGEEGPFRDIVLLNVAAALIVAGKAQSIAGGVAMAEMSIDSGAALVRLERLIEVSNA